MAVGRLKSFLQGVYVLDSPFDIHTATSVVRTTVVMGVPQGTPVQPASFFSSIYRASSLLPGLFPGLPCSQAWLIQSACLLACYETAF